MTEPPTEPTPEDPREDVPTAPTTPAASTPPLAADEAPTEAASTSATEAPAPSSGSPAPDTSSPAPGTAARPGWSGGRVLVIGILVLVLGAGAGFLLGRSTADSGPTTLAAAVDQTVKGDLPAGDLSLDQLLQAAGQRLGSGDGGLGGLLGGDGQGGANGVLGQILDQLGKRLGDRLGDRPTAPDRSTAFLGIATEAAPNGQSGARVARVATDSPAADAGLQVGDVVTAVDGAAVADPAALVRAVRSHQPGDRITVTLARGGASTDVKVRLGNSGSSTTAPTTPPTTRTT